MRENRKMKARVIETGEIVDLQVNHMDEFFTKDGVRFIGLELDFDYQPDYWEKLKHQYAGMAMQGILSSGKMLGILGMQKEKELDDMIGDMSVKIATTLVNRLKEDKK
jgi:hypothetical protein